ncbi:Aldose 1-epimerase [Paenibacillus sp. P1XP2]|nr:Aldose 1-epimerase [Paenibacillus sp. P1XP2]
MVVISQKVGEGHLYKQYLPFDFTVTLRYTLNAEGLHQKVTIVNDGKENMPNLLAFHTAINAPFVPGSKASDYTFKVTIGERREMDERMLPTGRFQPLSAEEELMKTEGVSPYFAEMDNHYTASPQNGRNRMELTDNRTGDVLVYDVGTSYKHWMIWNNGAPASFSVRNRKPIWSMRRISRGCLRRKSDFSDSSRANDGKKPARFML